VLKSPRTALQDGAQNPGTFSSSSGSELVGGSHARWVEETRRNYEVLHVEATFTARS